MTTKSAIDPLLSSKCPMAKIESISARTINYIRRHLQRKYKGDTVLRAFHAKTIGLVEATLVVPDHMENPALKTGLFKEPGEFKAWVRFTNGSSNGKGPDTQKQARGMAIKIPLSGGSPVKTSDLNIEEDLVSNDSMIEKSNRSAQDILMITNTFFVPGGSSMITNAARTILGRKFFAVINLLIILTRHLKKAFEFRKENVVTPNILEEPYYSCSPFAFGEGKAIKWAAMPTKTVMSLMPKNPPIDFLRTRLIEDLRPGVAKENISFHLMVQFREDDRKQSLERTELFWQTRFYNVATIVIPAQNLSTPGRIELDARMFFSPGHCLPEHAPLGSLNLVRSRLYETLAKERIALLPTTSTRTGLTDGGAGAAVKSSAKLT